MTTVQNKSVIGRIFSEAMNNRNYSILPELIAPEFVNHGIPMPQPGPDGFKAIVQQFADGFPDMQIKLEHVIADGDFVATSGYMSGTNTGSFMGMPVTNKKVNFHYIDIWQLKNGKAVANWVQLDNTTMLQQMGLMAEPA